MSTTERIPAQLAIEALVAPISSERPCGSSREHGEDLDLEVAFGQLRLDFDMARRIERAQADLEMMSAELRQAAIREAAGRPDSPGEVPPWDRIFAQSEQILSKHSKDMRVAAWLVEAAVRVHGFVGLRDALDLCQELIARYGDQLFPASETDKLSKYVPIKNLNASSSLMAAIQRVSFLPGQACHLTAYNTAKHIHSLPTDAQEEHRQSGKLTLDDFTEIIVGCSPEQIADYYAQIDQTLESAQKIDATLRSVSGPEYYSFGKVIEQLEQVRDWFKGLCDERPETVVSQEETAVAVEDGVAPVQAKSGSTDTVANAIRSREEALNQLLKVAKYFRATEPHSPLSYALEQAVRWGKMGLPDLLKDLVQDSSVLNEVYRRMGIQDKEENNN